MVIPHARGSAELDIQPVDARFLIVRAMEAGHAQQAEPVRLSQKFVDFERRIVGLLVAPRVGYFVVQSVFNEDRARRDPGDQQIAIDRQPVFTAGEKSQAGDKPGPASRQGTTPPTPVLAGITAEMRSSSAAPNAAILPSRE